MDLEIVKNKIYIVIGEEHYNPLGVVRSLGENGIKPIVIVKNNTSKYAPEILSKSKYIKKLYQVDSYYEVYDILKKYEVEDKPIIIPCDDLIVAYLDSIYESLNSKFIIPNAQKNNRIQHYEKKEILNKLAMKHGLNVPKSWKLHNNEIPNDIIYPVITKPEESYENWKEDYYICNNKEELIEAINKVKGKIFIQQYIKKINELCLDGCSIDKGNQFFVSIASEYTYILPDYYSMEMVVKNFDDKELQNKLNLMFKEIQFEGIFSIEFMKDSNDRLWFLEINFRNSTWSYASTCLNMNLPLIWSFGMIIGNFPDTIYKKIPKDYIALAEIKDFEMRVRKYKMLTFTEWLSHVKRANCLFYFNKQDLKPYISIWLKKICNVVEKKLLKFGGKK